MSLKSLATQDIDLQIIEVEDDGEAQGEVESEGKNEVSTYLKLTYVGEAELLSGWRIYFSLGLDLADDEHRVSKTLIDGRYGYLSPGEEWQPLLSGQSIEIKLKNWLFTGMQLKAKQGFHLSYQAPGSNEEILLGSPSLQNPELVALRHLPNKWISKTSPSSDTNIQTARHVYEKNAQHQFDEESQLHIIPAVDKLKISGHTSTDAFSISPDEKSTAALFLRTLLVEKNVLADDGMPIHFNECVKGYELEIGQEAVLIRGATDEDLFHAAQTFRQILDSESGTEQTKSAVPLPTLKIVDQADFEYRGFYLDIARHFQNADQICKTIDAMASYKMNVLQLGISNDEGWRLAIEPVPELTEIGSRRSYHASDDNGNALALYPAWGDDHEEEGGFLSRQTMVAILKYAADRHVDIVLEFNLPGHANALIRSLSASAKFQVADPLDESVYKSAQGYTGNVVNVAMDDTYRFVRVVLEEIASMYQQAGVDFKRIHFGGDETPDGAWLGSPVCKTSSLWDQNLSDENPDDVKEIRHAMMSHHYQRVTEILEEVAPGVISGFWHEMSPHAEGAAGNTQRYFNAWTTEAADRAIVDDLLTSDRQVVISNASFLYFDMPYGLHHQEPGLPWAAYIDTELVYHFDPLSNWAVSDEHKHQILGLQAQLWGETVYSSALMDYYVFPRLLAVAERGWNAKPDDNWTRFSRTLGQRELAHLEGLGVEFRIPTPGAVIEDEWLHANAVFPDLEIVYRLDGQEPNENSPRYTGPVKIKPSDRPVLCCKTRGARVGRSVSPIWREGV